jgi:large subunit ribosomal protein L24
MEESIQPRKQRKFRYNAPMHARRKMVSVHLSKELRAKLGTGKRNIAVRKGDRVKVMCGERKSHAGKVMEVDLSTLKIYVEGASERNAKGVEKLVPIDPSNLMLIEGDFSKDRLAAIQRSKNKVRPAAKKTA